MKRTIAFILCIALLFCLSACVTKKADDPLPQNDENTETAENTDLNEAEANETEENEEAAPALSYESLKEKYPDLIPTDEFFTRNSRDEILKNHKTYISTEKMSALDYPSISYGDSDMYASSEPSYATCRTYFSYILFTDGTASEINYNYYLLVSDGSMKMTDTYGDLLSSPEAVLSACTKTETGYDAEMITYFNGMVVYSSYCCDRDYEDGDFVRYELKLNENYEILSVNSYYVPADGSEPLLFKTQQVEYDAEELPEFVKNIKNFLDGDHYIITLACDFGYTVQKIVYGSKLTLDTDCSVYKDMDYTEQIEPDQKYTTYTYNLELTDNLTLFLKEPESK